MHMCVRTNLRVDMDGWMDGWMDERFNGYLDAAVSRTKKKKKEFYLLPMHREQWEEQLQWNNN